MNSPGLRERKKEKTRWAIQEHALRLFAERGYEATTVDQIAAAAEISPSTFFRYFPSKEDLVIQDRYDSILVDLVRKMPADLSPLAALRRATRTAFEDISATELEQIVERSQLVMSVPALRARSMDNFLTTIGMVRTVVAERTGRAATDIAVRAFAGAVVGALVAVFEVWLQDPKAYPVAQAVDDALAYLESGLNL
jgi:AcrR family transcriptional regulator